jgi:hypothetical protein
MDRAKPGIVMELIKGRPLNFLLHDDDFDPKLDFNDTIDYAKQISQVRICNLVIRSRLFKFIGDVLPT